MNIINISNCFSQDQIYLYPHFISSGFHIQQFFFQKLGLGKEFRKGDLDKSLNYLLKSSGINTKDLKTQSEGVDSGIGIRP